MLTIEQAAQALGFTLTDRSVGVSTLLGCKFYNLKKDGYELWMYDYLESYDPEFDRTEGHKADGFVELRIEKFMGRENMLTQFVYHYT